MIKLTHTESRAITDTCAKQPTEKRKVLTAFQLGVQYALSRQLPRNKVPALLKKGN